MSLNTATDPDTIYVSTPYLTAPVNLTTQVSGTLPVANGGTNATNAAAARTSLGAVNIAGDSMTGALNVDGRITARSATGAVQVTDQTNSSNSFSWVSSSDTLFCNHNGAANVMQLSGAGAVAFSGALTVTSGIVGTNTNNNAAAGMVGEFVVSQITYASRIGYTSGAFTNLTSIALTAGDWDIGGNVRFDPSSSITNAMCWLNTVSASQPDPSLLTVTGPNGGAGFTITAVAPSQRLSLSGSATLYLSVYTTFTGTCSISGIVWARRAR